MAFLDRLSDVKAFVAQMMRQKEELDAPPKESPVWTELMCMTHTGRVREHNEDNFAVESVSLPAEHQSLGKPVFAKKKAREPFAAAVFDGMGGEFGGELASAAAARAFLDWKQDGIWSREEILRLIEQMHNAVCAENQARSTRQMGTTYVGFFAQPDEIWIANIGDSPAFLLRDGEFTLLTQAHTNAEFLKRMGIKGRKPALTQFLGLQEEGIRIDPFVTQMMPRPGDLYLFCSDGLTDMVSEQRIAEILQSEIDLSGCMKKLLTEALENGGKDNITILLLRIVS